MNNTYNNNPELGQTEAVALPRNYQPNAEELKILAECRKESNLEGGMAAALCGALTYQSIKTFNWNLHPKFGYYPKVGSAIVFGFIVGKLMAIPSCYEKFKDLPDSPIGAYLKRKNRSLTDGLQLSMESTSDTNLSFPIDTPTQYTEGHMNAAIDIDVYNSPSNMDSYTGNELNGPRSSDDFADQNFVNKPTVSYAELRNRNREEYSRGDRERSGPIANNPAERPSIQRPPPVVPFDQKNKYGDVWGN